MGLLLLAGIAASAIIFAVDRFITLSCISNPVGGDLIGTTRWTGVSVRSLLDEWGVRPNATHLRIRSADDYYEVVSLSLIRSDERVMLVHACRLGEALSPMTWTVWRAEFPLASGSHALTVRCIDGEGAPQLTVVAPPHPSGTSGLHRRSIEVA